MSLQQVSFCLLLIAPLVSGVVQFKQSALYDINDFLERSEVPLPQCEKNGCLIFASTLEEGQNDYAKQLVLRDETFGLGQSIANISKFAGTTSRKMPYDAGIPGRYWIDNLNGPSGVPSDLSVWVIDRVYAATLDYEIYDAGTMARRNDVPKSVVTVMGARQFVVEADRGAPNVLTARLTGFDNAKDGNDDQCTYAYQTKQFNGFEFHVDGPIVSIAFEKKNLVAIRASYNYLSTRNLTKDGFITSPGYNGCQDAKGLYQPFRQLNENFGGADFDLKSNSKLRVEWEISHNVSQEVVVNDMTNSQRYSLTGKVSSKNITMIGTQFVDVYYNNVKPPYGFILRHSATKA